MPNIGALTLATAAFEAAVAVGLVVGGRANRLAALAGCGFFCFLLALGYGWPTGSILEDFAKNRAGSLLMLALMARNLLAAAQPRLWKAFRRG